jgi:hypothetical protein
MVDVELAASAAFGSDDAHGLTSRPGFGYRSRQSGHDRNQIEATFSIGVATKDDDRINAAPCLSTAAKTFLQCT